MPSRAHQTLIRLFRRDPKLAVELAARIRGRTLPADFVVRDRQGVLDCPMPDGSRAIEMDLLLSVHKRTPEGSAGELLCQLWIVEVQLSRSRGRVRAWTDYFLAVMHEYELAPDAVDMLIVSPDAGIRRWVRRRVLTRMKPQPLVLEPHHVPWLEERDAARARPEAAVLSAVFHGHQPHARGVVHVACHALAALPAAIQDPYLHLIRIAAHEHMDLPLPRSQPDYDDTPSEWEEPRPTWREIFARHEAKTRAQTRREDLLIMLELLGLVPSHEQRHHIERCEDAEQLGHWIRSLSPTTTLDELFATEG